MVLPQIPLPVIIFLPILFILLIIFTDIRYDLKPKQFVSHATTISSLAVGFVFLYALTKYDRMDANYPVVVRNIIYLADLALEYDPSLICYLIQYLNDFIAFDNTGYPIIQFEAKLIPLITDQNLIFRVRESVSILEDISNQRISGENLIAAPIWYVVFLAATLFTVIFPMDVSFENRVDPILLIILIWVPVVTIYTLYTIALSDLDNAINTLIQELKIVVKKEKINCCDIVQKSNNFNLIGNDDVQIKRY
jgi:hypothetical protein